MHDEATPGLIYNRYRIWDTILGRYITTDPTGYPDGLNAYAGYHIMWGLVDPMGLQVPRGIGDLMGGIERGNSSASRFETECGPWRTAAMYKWELIDKRVNATQQVTLPASKVVELGLELADALFKKVPTVTTSQPLQRMQSPDLFIQVYDGAYSTKAKERKEYRYIACECVWNKLQGHTRICCTRDNKTNAVSNQRTDTKYVKTSIKRTTYGVLYVHGGKGWDAVDCDCPTPGEENEWLYPHVRSHANEITTELIDSVVPSMESIESAIIDYIGLSGK